jgi:RimJ/RimL family protein N-acetyltransferase
MGPELTDGVIVLSMLTVVDTAALVDGEDEHILRRLSAGPSTLETAARRIAVCAEHWAGDWYRGGAKLVWGVRDVATGALAGTAEVQLCNPELAAGAANLSYGVFPGWRGRRYGSRAVGLMCEFLATRTTASVAILRIDSDNGPSLRVAEQSSFTSSQELAAARASMLWFSRSLPTRAPVGS